MPVRLRPSTTPSTPPGPGRRPLPVATCGTVRHNVVEEHDLSECGQVAADIKNSDVPLRPKPVSATKRNAEHVIP